VSVGRHTAYNLAGSLIPIALSFVTVPLYLHLVGAERYGVLSIAWLLLGYFGLFDLGLGRATSFRIAALRDEPPEARSRTFWAALLVNLLMGAVAGLLLLIAGYIFFAHVLKVSEDLRTEIVRASPILALAAPLATMTGVLSGALQGREKFLQLNVVSTLSTVLFQVFPLSIAWLAGPNLSWLLVSAISARLIAVLALAYLCHREITRGQRVELDRTEAMVLLKYGGWVNLATAVSPVLFMTDRFLIGGVLGARTVTDYTVPYQLASRTSILSGSLTAALFPRLSSADAGQRDALSTNATIAVACILGPAFVFGVCIMGPFLQLWVGGQLGPAAPWVGRLVLFAMWGNALALVAYTTLQASGRPATVSKIMMAEIPPYLVMLSVGATTLGLVGCGLATAARAFFDYLLLTFFAHRRVPAWRIVSAQTVLVGLAVWLSGLWPISDWRWWAVTAALTGVALACAAVAVPAALRRRVSDVISARLAPRGGTGI
jgi:O-antigen/teichoic acid export membrane protein